MHKLNELLREGLQGIVFIKAVGQGGKGVYIDVLPNSHGSFCKGGAPGGDSDVSCDHLTSPAGDDKVGELAIVLDKVAGSEVMAGNNGGWGSLLAESGDLLLEVADRVLIGGSLGDEGLQGCLGDVSKGFCAPPDSEGLEDGEG